MNEQISINPNILTWARKLSGYSINTVVQKLNRKRITAETIKGWESGTDSPTYLQLERLAYEIYKRPLAVFFFPTPPEEETPEQSFRTLPKFELDKISPRIRALIRSARAMQLNLAELYENEKPVQLPLLTQIEFQKSIPIDILAQKLRSLLDISLTDQKSWKNPESAFENWRKSIQNHGVFVFKNAFKDDAISGFCLQEELYPLIYINNSNPHTRQQFTLFHELAHLMNRTSGVDFRSDKFISRLSGENRQIEIKCNKFAGEFLVPSIDFENEIQGIRINSDSIADLAKLYNISREVILRKLLDTNKISKNYYDTQVEQMAKFAKSKKKPGGNYYYNLGTYLGKIYLEMAFAKFYQKRISREQLADYLNVKVKSISGMESLLYKQ